jgi:mycothiol synthase
MSVPDPVEIPMPGVVELPAIPGLAIRPLRAPDDYPAMNAVANRRRQADGVGFATSDEDFAAFYSHLPNCDPARDVFVVTVDDAVIGYARTAWGDEVAGDGARIHEVICFLDPGWTRRGIGRAMLATLEARVREIALEDPGVPVRVLQTETGDRAAGQEALLREAGYEPVRYAFTMRRPTLEDQPDAPLPEGLEIRDVKPEHLRAIWEAEVEAFRDEWGATEPTEETYLQFLDGATPGAIALWRIGWDGDQVAGVVRGGIGEEGNRRDGVEIGWLATVSVRRPWRRRGLARALMAASFPLLRARGMTESRLGVDSENPSGALRVYESVGFEPIGRQTVYRKRLGPDARPDPSA